MNCRIALLTSLCLATTPLFATTYTLEPDYTQGVFRWNHLGFSNPAAQFSQGVGTLEFDQADPSKSSVYVTIPLSTVKTGVAALDEHFRSADFFETDSYPLATFKSNKVERGAAANQLKVTGSLSIHGVIKPITLDVTVIKIGTNPRNSLPTVGFEATTTLKRSDFGLGKYAPQVSDEVQMRIISQAVDAKAYLEYQQVQAAAEAAKTKDAAKDAAKK